MRSSARFPASIFSTFQVLLAGLFVVLTLTSCESSVEPPQDPGLSPNASPEIVEALRQDLELPRHESDGAGTATLVDGPEQVQAGGSGTWTFLFEAGPLGIVDGGWIFFQVSSR